MTNPLQKRKTKEPTLNNPRSKTQYRSSARKDRATVRQNPLLAKHWDHTLTPKRNFEKLGFVKKVNGVIDPRGGGERAQGSLKRKRGQQVVSDESERGKAAEVEEGEASGDVAVSGAGVVAEMKVIRDSEGRILRVAGGDNGPSIVEETTMTAAERAWGGKRFEDSTVDDAEPETVEEDDDEVGKDRLVDQMEATAARQSKGPSAAKSKKLSPREKDWCARMVAKHGRLVEHGEKSAVSCDWDAMCRDSKMNVLQLSRGQMKEKIKLYLAKEKRALLDEDQ